MDPKKLAKLKMKKIYKIAKKENFKFVSENSIIEDVVFTNIDQEALEIRSL